MTFCPHSPRPRSAATREAILAAARAQFAARSYEDVGLRDIAGDAGVDAALVCRYFGSKEELFATVFESCEGGSRLLDGPRESFGVRVAEQLLRKRGPDEGLDGLLIMLRAVGSARAAELVRQAADRRFFAPLVSWLGGPDAAVRGRMLAVVLMGMAVSRELGVGGDVKPDERARVAERLAALLQALVDGAD